MFIPDGQWCDVTTLPDGRVALVYTAPDRLEALVLGEPTPLFRRALATPEAPLHHTRAAADGTGRICTVGQADTGAARITIDGRPIAGAELLGPTPGEACVEVKGLDAGWLVYLAREGYYETISLAVDGTIRGAHRVNTVHWPQGFLSADHGVLLTDLGRYYAPQGERLLTLPESLDGELWVGQHPQDPPRIRAARVVAGKVQTAVLVAGGGAGSKPHIARAGDGSLVVCAWMNGGTWVEAYRNAEAFPWGNEVKEPPKEPPIEEPPDEEPPDTEVKMQLPESVKATIRRVAEKFPIPSGPHGEAKDEAARQWTRRLAEQLRHTHATGWGTKSAGGGRPPSKDSIAYNGSKLWGFDVLLGVGTADTRLNIPDRGLNLTDPPDGPQQFIAVEPVDHLAGDVEEPPDEEPPVEEPPTQDPTNVLILAALQRLVELGETEILVLQRIEFNQVSTLQAIQNMPKADQAPTIAAIAGLERAITSTLREPLTRRVKF